MAVSETNFGEFIGVSKLYTAKITTDSASTWTTQTPKNVAKAASVAVEPAVNTKTRYYDNIAYYTTTTEGETKITLVISGIDIETKAELLGYKYNTTGTNSKRLWNNGKAVAPYFSFGFKADVEGGHKYYWFHKGKFEPYKEEMESKTTDINEKTTTLTYTAICTEHEWNFGTTAAPDKMPLKHVEGDTRTDNSITDTTWFSAVVTPTEP